MFALFSKKYHYVGPEENLALIKEDNRGEQIKNHQQLLSWLTQRDQHDDVIIATFVINKRGKLILSDRETEHVFCAQGQDVLSAGEMMFFLEKNKISLDEVTNQSTGYCPEAKSWNVVAKALKKLDISVPKGFTTTFEFRRCQQCDNINLVKDDWYVCAFCDEDLSRKWNIA